jgi:Cdc6-like AAA superfamily ATPase
MGLFGNKKDSESEDNKETSGLFLGISNDDKQQRVTWENDESNKMWGGSWPLAHILVGGARGSGKTSFMSNLIEECRNDSPGWDIIAIDIFKNGVSRDLAEKSDVHLIKDLTEATTTLLDLHKKMIQRIEFRMENSETFKLESFNRVILFVDDMLNLIAERSDYSPIISDNSQIRGRSRKLASEIISDLLGWGATVGIQVVISEENWRTYVISDEMRSRFGARVFMGTSSPQLSNFEFDSFELEDRNPGEGVFRASSAHPYREFKLVSNDSVRFTSKSESGILESTENLKNLNTSELQESTN